MHRTMWSRCRPTRHPSSTGSGLPDAAAGCHTAGSRLSWHSEDQSEAQSRRAATVVRARSIASCVCVSICLPCTPRSSQKPSRAEQRPRCAPRALSQAFVHVYPSAWHFGGAVCCHGTTGTELSAFRCQIGTERPILHAKQDQLHPVGFRVDGWPAGSSRMDRALHVYPSTKHHDACRAS
jgi:hypothetical protein